MKQLDKNSVAIKLSPEKKLKKIYETLKMFPQEKINPADEVLLKTGKFPSGMTLTEWMGDAFIHFNGEDWRINSTARYKTLTKPKQLRNILYAEHCKEGDYIIIKRHHEWLCKVKSYVNGELKVYGCMTPIDGYRNRYGIFTNDVNIIRYATQEEIDLLEGKKEKIAVRVDNEKEFNALMKYYDSLGWKHWNNDNSFLGNYIEYQDGFACLLEGQQEGYKIIPFSEFAKEHGIRVPLLVSEDGVELFEGDLFHEARAYNTTKDKWMYCHSDEWVMKKDSYVITRSETSKAFSTKQAALDWIEAQKPKQVKLQIGSVECTITKNGISFDESVTHLMAHSVNAIHKAMEELNS